MEAVLDRTRVTTSTPVNMTAGNSILPEASREGEDCSIIPWLSPLDMELEKLEALRKCSEGTGEWILHEPEFKKWASGHSKSPILWCPGLPGSGKTTTFSIAIDHLARTFLGPNTALAYVYCDSTRHGCTALELLSSICKQLALQAAELPSLLRKLYKEKAPEGEQLGIDDLMLVIFSLCDCFENVYMCFDELSECTSKLEREVVISKIQWMRNRSARIFITSCIHGRIFETCHCNDDIRDAFLHESQIEIKADEEDIRKCLLQRLKDDETSERVLANANIKAEAMVERLVSDCGGMFLMAQLKLDREIREIADESASSRHFSGKGPGDDVAAEDLHPPKGESRTHTKEGVWGDGLRSIKEQEPHRRDLALIALNWVMHALRPLQVGELVQALSIDVSGDYGYLIKGQSVMVQGIPDRVGASLHSPAINSEASSPAKYSDRGAACSEAQIPLFEICEGLIQCHGDDLEVCLSEDADINQLTKQLKELFPEAHVRLATTCIKFLTRDEVLASDQNDFKKDPNEMKMLQQLVPFKIYAKQYWTSHYLACHDPSLDGLLIDYLGKLNKYSARWLEVRKPWFRPEYVVEVIDDETPVIKAARLGLNRVLERLLSDEDYNVNAKSWREETAMSAAVLAGHASTVQLLYRYGGLIHHFNRYGNTLLHVAAQQDDEVMVALLLHYGIRPDFESGGNRETPLLQAARVNSIKAIKILLDYGAGKTAISKAEVLSCALSNGFLDLVKLLVQRGFDLHAPTGYGDTNILCAVKSGSLDMVEYAVNNGLFPTESDDQQTMVIGRAAEEGYLSIVELFLNHGADPFREDKRKDYFDSSQTALGAAIRKKHKDIVDLLVLRMDSGIPSEVIIGMVIDAIRVKSPETARLLLEKAPNDLTRLSTKRIELLLQETVLQDDEEILRILLDRGLSTTMLREDDSRSLLHVAAEGHPKTARVLLDLGADPNLRCSTGLTPLHYAAMCNSVYAAKCNAVEVLQLLLDHGADHSIRAEDVSTALVTAGLGLGPKSEAVKLLLQRGANASDFNVNGETVLHGAILDNDADLVQFILEQGIDLSIRCSKGGSALHLAAFKGYVDIVKLLLHYGADVELRHEFDGHASQDSNKDRKESENYDGVDRYRMWGRVEIQWTALHSAVYSGHTAIVNILLKHGAKVTSTALRGETPLHTAASACKPEIVKLLLEHGASILGQTHNGDTPLHSAAGAAVAIAAEKSHRASLCCCKLEREAAEKIEDHSKSDCIKILLDHGADPTLQNREGRNPLELAVVVGQEEIIETLLLRVPSNPYSPSAYAKLLELGSTGSTARILETVSNAFTETDQSRLAWNEVLNNGCAANNLDMVSLALRKGAELRLCNPDGSNPFHRAIMDEQVEIVDRLLLAGADIMAVDSTGRNALHIASSHAGLETLVVLHGNRKKETIARYLIEDGVPVNHRTPNGDTALHFAVSTGDTLLVRTLLDGGASVNIRNKKGLTPLHAAVSTWVFDEIIKMLLQEGASPTAQDNAWRTPLHLIRTDRKEGKNAADLLLQNGADHSICAANGDQAIHSACRRSNWSIVERLFETGASVHDQGRKGRMVLHIAAKYGREELTDGLINMGADVDAVDGQGWTPLDYAVNGNYQDVVSRLLEHQKLPSWKRKERQQTKAGGGVAYPRYALQSNGSSTKVAEDAGCELDADLGRHD